MARGPRYRVPFRRRREGKTNFKRRLALLKSGKPRVVVRKTLTQTIVQIVEYTEQGDRVIASSVSSELKKHGWSGSTSNIPAAYLVGYLAGKRAMEKGVSDAILDIGIHVPSKGARVFGAAKGVADAGVDMHIGEEIVPGDDRISGKHINPEMEKQFNEVKTKLEGA